MNQFNQPPKSGTESLEEKRAKALEFVKAKLDKHVASMNQQKKSLQQMSDELSDLQETFHLIKDGASYAINTTWEEMQKSAK